MKNPSVEAVKVINDVMRLGSAKDGCDDSWRQRGQLYHLIKAMSHLSIHIKQIIDTRTRDNENHLYLAITRLAMALAIK